MIKDRLSELRPCEEARPEEDHDGGGGGDCYCLECRGADAKEWDLFEFLEEAEEVKRSVDGISATVEEVRRYHSHVLSTPHSDPETRARMNRAMERIKAEAGKVRLRLRVMEEGVEREEERRRQSPESDSPSSPSQALLRIQRTQQSTLFSRFAAAMAEYNLSQVNYRARCKARIERHLNCLGKTIGDDELEEMLSQGTFTPPAAMISVRADAEGPTGEEGSGESDHLPRAALLMSPATLRDIESRRGDILDLEAAVEELHEMFLDMAVLVEAQGDMVDSIERHVEEAAEYLIPAVRNTKRALEYRGKIRWKRLFLWPCFCCFAVRR